VEKHGGDRQATDDNITRRMGIAAWIPKATNTHSEYVTLVAFPLQQRLRESILRYTYIACIVTDNCAVHEVSSEEDTNAT
jgi:hypothetical protein